MVTTNSLQLDKDYQLVCGKLVLNNIFTTFAISTDKKKIQLTTVDVSDPNNLSIIDKSSFDNKITDSD